MSAIANSTRIERLIDLRRRIHRVVDFIEDNLDEQMTLEELAEIACISPFHFHRQFTRVVGRSPTETIRHLRLLRAADSLKYDGVSIIEAAFAAGYGSTQAFARAYRREFGSSPTAARVAACGTEARPGAAVAFSIVKRSPLRIDAIMYNGERFLGDLLVVDAQTYVQYAGNGSCEIISVYFDDLFAPADRPIQWAMGIHPEQRQIASRKMEVRTLEIDGGYYACVRHRGRLLDLAPHWQRFLHNTLPASGWLLRPGNVLREFASDRAITPLSRRIGYIYVPVEPRA